LICKEDVNAAAITPVVDAVIDGTHRVRTALLKWS
jgi:hypothetical protein